MFAFFLAVFLVCSGIRAACEIMITKGRLSEGGARQFIFMLAVMILLWASWFGLCDTDPNTITLPLWLSRTGLVLFLAGLGIFFATLVQFRGFSGPGRLVTSGLFRKVRHPMYVGFGLWVIGYPLHTGALTGLVLTTVGFFNVLFWRACEERRLVRAFPGYEAYRAQTWF